MIQFLESRDWFAARIGWIDDWMKEAGTQVLPLPVLQEEAEKGSIFKMAVEKCDNWNTPVVDLSPLIADERDG